MEYMGRFSQRQHFLAADVTKIPDFESLQLLASLFKRQKVNSFRILGENGARKCPPTKKNPPGNVCRKWLKFLEIPGNLYFQKTSEKRLKSGNFKKIRPLLL